MRTRDPSLRSAVQLRRSRHAQLDPGEALDQYGARRLCRHPGCETRLSVYNPSDTCTMHAGWKDTHQRHHG